MWISKKKYNELVAEKERYKEIASETIQLNGRVIESNEHILEEMKGVQELSHNLQRRNEELVTRCQELEARLIFVMGQRDYYYDLLENADGVHVGDVIVREEE